MRIPATQNERSKTRAKLDTKVNLVLVKDYGKVTGGTGKASPNRERPEGKHRAATRQDESNGHKYQK